VRHWYKGQTTSILLSLTALALGACGSTTAGGEIDAGDTIVPSDTDDASVSDTPDAHSSGPDAHASSSPDAHASGSPDAHVSGSPDAHVSGPDAHVSEPDAGPPPCVGTWDAIPALTVDGVAVTPEAVTSAGDTLYVLYPRANTPGFHDLARYSAATGWRGSRSQNAVTDLRFVSTFTAKDDHVIITYFSSNTGAQAPRRAILSLGTQMWTVSDPYTGSTWQSDIHMGVAAITTDFLINYGGLREDYDASVGWDRCSTDSLTRVTPLDSPAGATAAFPTDSPLGERGEPASVGVAGRAFFFGGDRWPDPPGTCTFAMPTTMHDGAFYEPVAGVWSNALSIEPMSNPNPQPPSPITLTDGTRVIVVEDFDEGAHGVGRVHTALPDSLAFTSVDMAEVMYPIWMNSGTDFATLTAAGQKLVLVTAQTAQALDLTTGEAAPLCAPPAAFPAVRDQGAAVADNFGGHTSDGAIIYRAGTAAILHLP
jgi:hypothetical protein